MIFHPVLTCRCDHCAREQSFENPHAQADYLLEHKARDAGWFVAHTGMDLCPPCAARLARQLGVPSLWDEPRPIGIPLADRPKPTREAASAYVPPSRRRRT